MDASPTNGDKIINLILSKNQNVVIEINEFEDMRPTMLLQFMP